MSTGRPLLEGQRARESRFPPLKLPAHDPQLLAIATATTVRITTVSQVRVELVLTFAPSAGGTGGAPIVAARQTVTSEVLLDLSSQAGLCWMGQVLTRGNLSPNQLHQRFTDNADVFSMPITSDITLAHDDAGWNIPHYDSTKHTVSVGFGLMIQGWAYWSYSIPCSPGQPVPVSAGSYELVRWDGHEKVGDPVALSGLDAWKMPMGQDYALSFDARGNGKLTAALFARTKRDR
ncbi:MAG: hypothetical protein R3B70_41320 [Polyangiaceae bacterium]